MHVVLVVPGGVDRGGTERVIPALLSLIERLAAHHLVTVVALGQEPQASVYPLLGATVVNVPPERRGPHRLARQVARGVAAIGSQGRPDVVHAMWASVTGLCAVIAARRSGAPSVVHVAGGELVAMPEIGYGGALGRGGRMITRSVLRRATQVTAASHWMADHVRSTGHTVHEIVPLGADARWFAAPAEAPRSNRLVHVASLNAVKDQTTLLRAVALARHELPDLCIDIVGVDTLDGGMQRLACDLGLGEAATFHGWVPHRELAAVIGSARLHVLTSRHDAGPLAVLEAALCGVPTVGSAVGHVADLATASPAGAVAVAPAAPKQLAAAIVSLLADDDRRAALSRAAREWAADHDADHTARCFEGIYSRLSVRS